MKADSALVNRVVVSPNFGARLGVATPDMLVLHYTGMESGQAALERLADPASQVSCHYVIEEDGTIIQMVPEAARAWHAGLARWRGVADVNSCSIGIEIVNGGHDFGLPDYPKRQIDAVIALCLVLIGRYNIASQRVLGHSDVSPRRKQDPGEKFPWGKLARAGVGHFVAPSKIVGDHSYGEGDMGPEVQALQAMLSLYGYGLEVDGFYGPETYDVVSAFQRHFRPERVDGRADVSTCRTLWRLLSGIK